MTKRDTIEGSQGQSLMRATARKVGRRWLAWRYRNFDLDKEPEREVKVAGLKLRVLPNVFNPALHFTSAFFSRHLKESGVVKAGSSVLDVGTGSGVLAITAALAGARSVIAVDINPAAVESARLNAAHNGVGAIVDVVRHDSIESDACQH